MRRIILGTDWWTDCDDVAALRICAKAHKAGLWQLSGVCIDACMEMSAASVNAFLTADGLPDIPIGIDHRAVDFLGEPVYQYKLAEKFPHRVNKNTDCPDALELYKRLLSESGEKETDIIEIGFPHVLASLLKDPTGYELVRTRVRQFFIMGGCFADGGMGREHNFSLTEKASRGAAYFCANAPCPVTFLGFEVGASVISGGNPENDNSLSSDPLVCAFDAHGSHNGRSSWDPMTVLLALIDDPEKAGYTCHYGTAAVDPLTGDNSFKYNSADSFEENAMHRYVVKAKPDDEFSRELNSWLRY